MWNSFEIIVFITKKIDGKIIVNANEKTENSKSRYGITNVIVNLRI